MSIIALRSIDRDKLMELAEKGIRFPEKASATLKATVECKGEFLNEVRIRDLPPVMVDEPPRLLGTNTAPNPSEVVLAGLGACLSVGFMANATARGIRLYEIVLELEGDLNTSATWGVGNTTEGNYPGFREIRVKATLKGDAPEEELEAVKRHALQWSPVANTLTHPVPVRLV
ncbi:MAG: OsmC family protein [Alicyclobacillaceae bacterium]|nr:OsmC family protein [Alicyclobacillaceae bacterium]